MTRKIANDMRLRTYLGCNLIVRENKTSTESRYKCVKIFHMHKHANVHVRVSQYHDLECAKFTYTTAIDFNKKE